MEGFGVGVDHVEFEGVDVIGLLFAVSHLYEQINI